MTPQEIKAKVQGAYVKALENRNTQWERDTGIHDLVRDLRLYSREAGVDFVETHLDRIVREAVETAECKGNSLTVMAQGWGRGALDAMARTLQESTALKVEVTGTTVRLIWAEANPRLV